MGYIIEPLVGHSHAGCAVACADNKVHELCPEILMISSDIEEQYVYHLFSTLV